MTGQKMSDGGRVEGRGRLSDNRDFKQRGRGRRRGPQALRENPNNRLRMTGGKKFDVLRSAPT